MKVEKLCTDLIYSAYSRWNTSPVWFFSQKIYSYFKNKYLWSPHTCIGSLQASWLLRYIYEAKSFMLFHITLHKSYTFATFVALNQRLNTPNLRNFMHILIMQSDNSSVQRNIRVELDYYAEFCQWLIVHKMHHTVPPFLLNHWQSLCFCASDDCL